LTPKEKGEKVLGAKEKGKKKTKHPLRRGER